MLAIKLLLYGAILALEVSARLHKLRNDTSNGVREFVPPAVSFIGDSSQSDSNDRQLWTKYAQRGQKLWGDWQDRRGADASYPVNLLRSFKVGGKPVKTSIRPETAHVLQTLAKDGEASFDQYKYFNLSWTPENLNGPDDEAHFVCFTSTSARQGILIAADIDRGNKLPKAWHFSHLGRWMWVKTVEERNPNADADGPAYKDLSYWFQEIATNAVTQKLIGMALSRLNAVRGRSYIFRPDNLDLDNAFWALLASPNMASLIFLLTEHKQAMEGKEIDYIAVYWGRNPLTRGKQVSDLVERTEEPTEEPEWPPLESYTVWAPLTWVDC